MARESKQRLLTKKEREQTEWMLMCYFTVELVLRGHDLRVLAFLEDSAEKVTPLTEEQIRAIQSAAGPQYPELVARFKELEETEVPSRAGNRSPYNAIVPSFPGVRRAWLINHAIVSAQVGQMKRYVSPTGLGLITSRLTPNGSGVQRTFNQIAKQNHYAGGNAVWASYCRALSVIYGILFQKSVCKKESFADKQPL